MSSQVLDEHALAVCELPFSCSTTKRQSLVSQSDENASPRAICLTIVVQSRETQLWTFGLSPRIARTITRQSSLSQAFGVGSRPIIVFMIASQSYSEDQKEPVD